MSHKSFVMPIAPEQLRRAIAQQRCVLPDDADTLDRLYQQLELNRPMLAEIKASVCDFYAIAADELCGRYRAYETALARQIFCYLAHKYTSFSLGQIGRAVGLTNHTTVHHAIRKIAKRMITDHLLHDDLDLLRIRISEKVLLRRRAFAC